MEESMKLIKKLLLWGLISLSFSSCFGGNKVKLKKSYDREEELKQDIVNAVSEQYGMQFEIGKGLGGSNATIGVRGKDFGFYGNLRPADLPEAYKKYNIYTDYTVGDDVYFETQAHVRMFENQLKADVDKILDSIGVKYDIIEFRGMDRDINKWSKKSTYEEYKSSKDYETWIYIKLEKALNEKDYPKHILPIVKKIYTTLEPDYNPTLLFYLDDYHSEYYDKFEKKLYVEDIKNPVAIFLDLSKYSNYLEWTENDIEMEINISHEEWFITAWKKANGIE